MGAFIVIIPVFVFDLWLLATTGKGRIKVWAAARAWPRLAGLAAAGVVLAVWLAFFVKYSWGSDMRVTGFPIPDSFTSLQDGKWSQTKSPPAVHLAAIIVNLFSGLAAPFLPFKAAEFLRAVKAEL